MPETQEAQTTQETSASETAAIDTTIPRSVLESPDEEPSIFYRSDGEAAPEESPTAPSETDPPAEIELFGEKYAPDSLKELLSNGQEFARKNQELADQRKASDAEIDAFNGLKSMIEGSPQTARAAIDFLRQEAITKHGDAFETASAEATPELPALSNEARWVKSIVDQAKSETSKLRTQVSQQAKQLEAVHDFLKEHGETLKGATFAQTASTAIAALKSEFGLDVTAADLAQAMKGEGINDPIKAWKLANLDRLRTQAISPPRSTPKSGSKTFDPDSKTADEIVRLMNLGFTPHRD